MSGVTEISFLCDNATFQTTTTAQVGRRASDFVQVPLERRFMIIVTTLCHYNEERKWK
jgi:hypothetical protein